MRQALEQTAAGNDPQERHIVEQVLGLDELTPDSSGSIGVTRIHRASYAAEAETWRPEGLTILFDADPHAVAALACRVPACGRAIPQP